MESFQSNFKQVAPSIIHLAREKKGQVSEELKPFLSMLDCDPEVDDAQEERQPTIGAY